MTVATGMSTGEFVRQLESHAAGLPAPNGAIILQAKIREVRDVERHEFVVLCLWHEEFITWRMYVNAATGDRECFWGHYHGNRLAEALKDFEER